jgi:hypothetical protein
VQTEKGRLAFVRDGWTLDVASRCVKVSSDLSKLVTELLAIVANDDPDRARCLNGVGFNGKDGYLHDILAKAGQDGTALTAAQVLLLASKCVFYRRQLEVAGIEAETIEAIKTVVRITKNGGTSENKISRIESEQRDENVKESE